MDEIRRESEDKIQEAVGRYEGDLSRRPTSEILLLAGLLIAVCAAVFIAHWPALSAEAMSFDDQQYLSDNLLVQTPGWRSAKRFLTEVLEPSTVHGYYQPLAMISLMVDCALGGHPDNLMPFHRTSLALHAANTALIIILLYLLFGRALLAAGVGLLFGLHPMTVEPIPWVGERKTLLAAFFALWCLILYVRFARRGNWRMYLGCLLMYLLALMSKPTSVPLPALMLLMDYWPLRRLKGRAVLEKLPFFALAVVSAIITYISQSRTAVAVLPSDYGAERIPLVLCHNIIFYLYKIIWPVNLSSHYAFPEPFGLSKPMVAAGVVGSFILIVLLLISLRWTRAALTGWLIFFVAIFPTMGVVGFTNVIASDKFAYLPSVGLLMALTCFLVWFCIGPGKHPARRVAVAIVILILAGAEATGTRRYLTHWQDTVGLCKYMLTLAPNAASVHDMLGVALAKRGEFDEAISHYHRALEIRPDFVEALTNLGLTLQIQGKLDEAVACFRRGLQVDPNYAKTHYNLGLTFRLQGKLDEAISQYRQALRANPEHYKAHNNLGLALQAQGKLDEAISHFRQVLQIKPDYVKAYHNLGMALAMSGRTDEALKHFQQAVSLEPNYLLSLNAMAWILATHPEPDIRDGNKAVHFAERAAKLTLYKNASILDTLAAAYAAAGQFDRAVTTAQAAIELCPTGRAEELASQIRKRLELYNQHKPYLELVQEQGPPAP